MTVKEEATCLDIISGEEETYMHEVIPRACIPHNFADGEAIVTLGWDEL